MTAKLVWPQEANYLGKGYIPMYILTRRYDNKSKLEEINATVCFHGFNYKGIRNYLLVL